MIAKIIYFDCAMLILDFVTINDLRKFLLDFLSVKKSRNNADQVYATQSLRDKITLSFIKAHLKKYIKEYTTFHRMYMAVLYTLIPQYVILIVSNILLGVDSVFVFCFFAGVKLIICFIVRMNVGSDRISIYRKNKMY